MSSKAKITKGDVSEDALPTERAPLGPDNPTNAGEGGRDEQEEALVIPEKAEVVEKLIKETRGTVIKGLPAAWRKKAYKNFGGNKRAPPGTVAMLKATCAAQEEGKKKGQHHH